MYLHAKSFQLCLNVCNPEDHSPPGSFIHGILPGKNTGMGRHSLLQGIFPTQGSNPHLLHLLHWQAGSLPLTPPGKPIFFYRMIAKGMWGWEKTWFLWLFYQMPAIENFVISFLFCFIINVIKYLHSKVCSSFIKLYFWDFFDLMWGRGQVKKFSTVKFNQWSIRVFCFFLTFIRLPSHNYNVYTFCMTDGDDRNC